MSSLSEDVRALLGVSNEREVDRWLVDLAAVCRMLQDQIDELTPKRNYCFQCGYWMLDPREDVSFREECERELSTGARSIWSTSFGVRCGNALVLGEMSHPFFGCEHFVRRTAVVPPGGSEEGTS